MALIEPTDKSTERQITQWMRRIGEGESRRDDFKPDWEDAYTAVFGDWWIKGDKRAKNTRVADNTTRKSRLALLDAFLRTEIPSLILYAPEVYLAPTKAYAQVNEATASDEAEAYQDELNQILNDMDGWETEIKHAVTDAHCAIGVVKVTASPIIKDAQAQTVTDMVSGVEYDITRSDPRKIIIDPRCKGDKSKARWIAEEITKTLDELQESDLYDRKVIAQLVADKQEELREKEPQDIEVTIYEIYDRKGGQLIVICKDWQKAFLRNQPTPEWCDKDPYRILRIGSEIPGQFYNRPEIVVGIDMQKDQRDLRDHLQDLARTELPKVGVSPNIQDAEVKKLFDGTSKWIKVNSPNDVFQINTERAAGKATGDYMGVLQRDFDEIMGQSQQDRGLTAEGQKLATEIEVAEVQGKIRESDKSNTVKVWIESIMEAILYAMQHGRHAELAGMNINIDLNITIDIESKSPKNKAIEKKQLTEMAAAYPEVKLSKTWNKRYFKAFDIDDAEIIYQEIMTAQAQMAEAAKPAPEAPKTEKSPLSFSVPIKLELLPEELQNAIIDYAFQKDMPDIPTGSPASAVPSGDVGADVSGTARPGGVQPPAAGTEGMEPGSGMLPSGDVI